MLELYFFKQQETRGLNKKELLKKLNKGFYPKRQIFIGKITLCEGDTIELGGSYCEDKGIADKVLTLESFSTLNNGSLAMIKVKEDSEGYGWIYVTDIKKINNEKIKTFPLSTKIFSYEQ